ncbi:MAG: hypothetical protein ABSA16_10675 [Thermoguttaceae bacterium]|jgi:hypothetical protein
MSDRERWIVYPLVFLTLGIALRNQFLPTRQFGAVDLKAGELTAQKITCNELVIREYAQCNQLQCEQFQFNEALGKHIRTLGLAECAQLKAGEAECRAILVVNADGKPAILAGADKNTQSGVIQTMNSNGMPLVQIRATDSGGLITTVGLDGKVLVAMGEEGQNIGVFAHFPQIGQTLPLTPPWRLETKPGVPKPSQTPTPIAPLQPANPPSSGKTP